MARRWIAGAIRRPGAFTAKARRAGMSVAAYARHIIRRFRGKKGLTPAQRRTLRQAVLAQTLRRIGRRLGAAGRRRAARKAARTRARRARK